MSQAIEQRLACLKAESRARMRLHLHAMQANAGQIVRQHNASALALGGLTGFLVARTIPSPRRGAHIGRTVVLALVGWLVRH